MTRIALIGDYSAAIPAHRAIPRALERVKVEEALDVSWDWLATRDLPDAPATLANFGAVWLVPGSPYENVEGALEAVRFARESKRPFLGTCGGFQHALIEFARDVLGFADADHAETNPHGNKLVVTKLACSLVEQTGRIHFALGSQLRAIYASESAEEGYRCNHGPAASYRSTFESAGFRFTAFDDAGEPRGGELDERLHPFFIGTLFQPERTALNDKTPPVVRAFAHAAHSFSP